MLNTNKLYKNSKQHTENIETEYLLTQITTCLFRYLFFCWLFKTYLKIGKNVFLYTLRD